MLISSIIFVRNVCSHVYKAAALFRIGMSNRWPAGQVQPTEPLYLVHQTVDWRTLEAGLWALLGMAVGSSLLTWNRSKGQISLDRPWIIYIQES